MAEEKEDRPIKAWLLIKTEKPITGETWPAVEKKLREILELHPGLVRADWVSMPDVPYNPETPHAPYDLVVPIAVKNDDEYKAIIGAIKELTFSPNKAEEITTAKVRGRNPAPNDPLRDNEWG